MSRANDGFKRYVHRPLMRFCHCVHKYLRRAGVVFELAGRVITQAAGTPEAETVFADKGGDIVLVQQSRICCRVLQIPEHIWPEIPVTPLTPHVGQAFVPSGLLVNFSAQTKRTGDGISRCFGIQHRVPASEVGPDQRHPFALAEVFTVSDRLLYRLAAIR